MAGSRWLELEVGGWRAWCLALVAGVAGVAGMVQGRARQGSTVRNRVGLRFRVLSSFLNSLWSMVGGLRVAGGRLAVAGGRWQENGGVAGVGLAGIRYGVSLPNRTETPQYWQYLYR